MTYLLDANVFIQAKNLHYGFDFCPAFWDWLDDQAATARVRSIEKVADELKAGGDELSTWAAARPDFFARPDAPVIASLQAARVVRLNAAAPCRERRRRSKRCAGYRRCPLSIPCFPRFARGAR